MKPEIQPRTPSQSVLLVRYVRTTSGWKRRPIPEINKTRGWEQRLDGTFAVWGDDVTELGQYYVRWFERVRGKSMARYEPAGMDYIATMTALERRANLLALAQSAKRAGVEPPAEVTNSRSLVKLLEPFLKRRKAKQQITAESTVAMYRSAVSEFLALAQVAYIEQVSADVLADYLTRLHERGLGPQSQANKFALVSTFLRAENPELGTLLREYTPRVADKTPISYTGQDLDPLFAYLDSRPEYRRLSLTLEMYLKTGMREKELTHLTWEMVDLVDGFLFIQDGRRIKLTDKDGEVREITFRTKTRKDRKLALPIEDSLLEKLRRYREQHPQERFLFPTKNQRPDTTILKKLQRAIRRAGLNCGVCDRCLSPCGYCRWCRCGKCKNCRAEVNRNLYHRRVCLNPQPGNKPCTEIVCRKWNLHRFRHTFATTALRKGVDIGMVQDLLGHASLATTQKYMSVATGDETRTAINRAFAS